MRREFPKAVMLQAWMRSNGHCEECGLKLFTGQINYDHVVPDQLGGEPILENCAVLCKLCHKAKTTKEDVPRIAKAKRQELKHLGIRRKHQWPKRKFG